MSGNEARIRLGVDGANEVRNALRLVRGDFDSLGSIGDKIGGTLKGIANGFVRLGVDAAKAANDMKAIDFGNAADKFKGLDDSLTRMAVKGGRNLEELRTRVTSLSKETGIAAPRFADAMRAFDRVTFSGLDGAADAVRALSSAADDSDESLEDMLKLGEDMFTRLGVPAQRVGVELKRLKEIAADVRLPMSAVLPAVMSPGAKRVQGGAPRIAAMTAALVEQGYSPQVAAEQVDNIVNKMNALPQHLVRRAIRSDTKAGRGYEPYTRNKQTGNIQLKDDSYEYIQQIYKKRGMGALVGLGGSDELEAGLALRDLDYKRVKEITSTPERIRSGGTFRLSDLHPGGSADSAARALYNERLGKTAPEGSEFSRTAAGQRLRTQAEKDEVEMRVGASVQGARDRRNAAYKGRRGTQAAFDTVTGYMPGVVQDAIQLSEAASYSSPGGGVGPAHDGGLGAAAQALHRAAANLEKMPQATVDALQKANIKVRAEPLGAARDAAKIN